MKDIQAIPFLEVSVLKEEYVAIIKNRVQEILAELEYHDIVIRDDIFKLLRKKSKVIFYPLDEEMDLDGFHVAKYMKDELTAFVYINSAKNFEKCIFCAAHELGHIYELEKDIEKEFPNVQFSTKEIDDIMNRFAAEMLMPQEVFHDKFRELWRLNTVGIVELKNGHLLKTIVALMDYFYVPYKSVVRRLWEIEFLTDMGREKFEKVEEQEPESVDLYIYEGKYTRLRHPSRHKSFEELPEYLTRAQDIHIISRRKSNTIRDEFEIDVTLLEDKVVKTAEDTLLDTDIMKGNL